MSCHAIESKLSARTVSFGLELHDCPLDQRVALAVAHLSVITWFPCPKLLPGARGKRCGKDLYLPRRLTESDRQRDQHLLSQIPSGSREQVERDFAAIKRMREEEMGSGGSADCRLTSSTVKRARCRRNGIDIYLPVRSSAAEQERDQQFLDSIDCRLSPEAVGLRVEEIEAQRAREIAIGVLESSPGASR